MENLRAMFSIWPPLMTVPLNEFKGFLGIWGRNKFGGAGISESFAYRNRISYDIL